MRSHTFIIEPGPGTTPRSSLPPDSNNKVEDGRRHVGECHASRLMTDFRPVLPAAPSSTARARRVRTRSPATRAWSARSSRPERPWRIAPVPRRRAASGHPRRLALPRTHWRRPQEEARTPRRASGAQSLLSALTSTRGQPHRNPSENVKSCEVLRPRRSISRMRRSRS